MPMNTISESCPFCLHGCGDVGIVTKDGFMWVMSFSCGARGPTYSAYTFGVEGARDLAIAAWNERKKPHATNGSGV